MLDGPGSPGTHPKPVSLGSRKSLHGAASQLPGFQWRWQQLALCQGLQQISIYGSKCRDFGGGSCFNTTDGLKGSWPGVGSTPEFCPSVSSLLTLTLCALHD